MDNHSRFNASAGDFVYDTETSTGDLHIMRVETIDANGTITCTIADAENKPDYYLSQHSVVYENWECSAVKMPILHSESTSVVTCTCDIFNLMNLGCKCGGK